MADMKLGLKRGDFNQHTVETFQYMLQDNAFNDVTLVCEDQRQVKGHKVILSSGSKFFKEILLKNPHPNPLIYLKLTYDHLYSIVRFIYLGQCEVDQSDIDSFLVTAQDLLIEGLWSEQEKEKSQPSPQIITDEPNVTTEYTQNTVIRLEEYMQEEKETTNSNETISHPESMTEVLKEEPQFEIQIESEETEQELIPINRNYSCEECGKIEFCEAALKVHKRKDHSAYNIETLQDEPKKNISNRTKVERKRDLNHFQTFVSIQTGTSLNQIIDEKDGNYVVLELLLDYFSNFRNQNGEIPSIGYISKLKSSINCELAEEFSLDLPNNKDFQNKWQVVISRLYNTVKSNNIVDNTETMKAEETKILSERTINERKRDLKYFQSYVSVQTGTPLNQIINGKNGIEVVQELFFDFFSNFRNQNGEIPSISYLSKLRSTMNSELITQFRLDLSKKEHFQSRWQRVISGLYPTDKSCKQCKIEFTDTSDLKRHMEIHQSLLSRTVDDITHKSHPETYNTEASKKDNRVDIASKESIANKREPSHNEGTSHICHKCDKTFTRAWKLRSHLKTH